MSSLHDRLLAICLHHGAVNKISTLPEFIEKVSSKIKDDDTIVRSVLKNLATATSSSIPNNDDNDDSNNDVLLEPPLEKRIELIAAFKNKNNDSKDDSTAVKKFELPFTLDNDAMSALNSKKHVNTFISRLDEDPRVHNCPVFVGDFDSEGVFLYAAFNDEIAQYALEKQTFNGCDAWNTTRTTWVKPSLGWVCYRSAYSKKPGQNNVLRIKISHSSLASILSQCVFVDTNKETKAATSQAVDDFSSSHPGRVQWDPERDIWMSDDGGKTPREMLKRRAIQIGVSGRLSTQYVESIIRIEDRTELCRKIGVIHKIKNVKQREAAMVKLINEDPEFPVERPYFPALCSNSCLRSLAMIEGVCSDAVASLGRGKAK